MKTKKTVSAQRVRPTIKAPVRGDVDLLRQALRDAIMWQNGIYESHWGNIPMCQRGERGRTTAQEAIRLRNEYSRALIDLDATNPSGQLPLTRKET